MKRLNINIGDRYGLLVIIQEVNPRYYSRCFLCKCDCGAEKVVSLNSLRCKKEPTKSCGCWAHKKLGDFNRTHGLRNHPLYFSWIRIRSRCKNPNNPAYKNYGGRGISVCKEWQNNMESFYNWAISNGYKPGLTLDRRNNDGDYTPDNCRWVDYYIQENNKRINRKYLFHDKLLTLPEICREIGATSRFNTISNRIYALKWSLKDALK